MPEDSILIRAGRKLVGDLTANHSIGAVADTNRLLLETDPTKIVYVNFQTGDDGTGDGTSGNPYKTYAVGSADVTGSKTTLEWMTNDDLPEITVPTQVSVGVVASMGADLFTWNDKSLTASDDCRGVLFLKQEPYKNRAIIGADGQGITTPKIYYSDDQGNNWTQATISNPSTGANIQTFYEASNGVILAGTTSPEMHRSIDGGVTWTTIDLSSSGILESTFFTYIEGTYYLVDGGNADIYSSIDAVSWGSRINTVAGEAVVFSFDYDPVNDVMFGGSNSAFEGNKVRYSTDRGLNWDSPTVPASWNAENPIQAIPAPNGNHIIFGNTINDKYLLSTNGGTTYTEQSLAVTLNPAGNMGKFVDADGVIYVCSENKYIGISSNNGTSFTFTQATFSANWNNTSLKSIALDEFKNGIIQGGSADLIALTNFDVTDSASGVNFTGIVNITTSEKYYNCSLLQLVSTNTIDLQRCLINSNIDRLIDITANIATIEDNLFIQETSGNEAIRITGASATLGNIKINQNTIIGDVYIDNDSGGLGLEQIRDNIIEGNIQETELVNRATIDSSNIRGVTTGFILSGNVFSLDPLFVDPDNNDYRLQREVGYTDTTRFTFDSPLAQGSVYETLDNGVQRESGAYSFDSSNLQYDFTLSQYFPKPSAENTIIVSKKNNVNIQIGTDGEIDLYNQPKLSTEQIEITYINLGDKYWNFLNQLDNLNDTRVFLSFSSNVSINLPSITVNGLHAVGKSEIAIDTAQIIGGELFTHDGIDYYIMFAYPSSSSTSITLNRPLESALPDNTVLTLSVPFGDGEYIYIPSNRQSGRIANTDNEYRTNVKLQFIRRAIQ